MKYTYKLTMMEAVSCSLRYVVLALLRRSGLFRGICLVWLGLLIVNRISISQESVLMYTGIMAGGGLRPVLVYLGFLIVIAFLNSFSKTFCGIHRVCCRDERTVRIENGVLWIQHGDNCQRYRCREIPTIEKWGRMYHILVKGRNQTFRWLFLPWRVIGGAGEQQAFLQYLEEQRKLPGEITDFMWKFDEGGGLAGNGSSDLAVSENGSLENDSNPEYHSLDQGIHLGYRWHLEPMARATVQSDWIRKRYLPSIDKKQHAFRIGRKKKRDQLIPLPKIRTVLQKLGPEFYEEPVQYRIDSRGIYRKSPLEDRRWSWEDLFWLLESDDWYFIYSKQGDQAVVLEKKLLGGWMAQKLFVQDCQKQGLRLEVIQPRVLVALDEKEQEEDVGSTWSRMREEPESEKGKWLVVMLIGFGILLLAIFLPDLSHRSRMASPLIEPIVLQPANGNLDEVFDDIKVIAGDTEKFDPAQYQDYVPLQEQVEVLRSLGFEISEELVQEFTTQMKDGYMWQVWVEGYPYYSLLSYIGTPDRDKDTWEITGYPDQAYWFDWEGFDLERDYEDILRGIDAMAGSGCAITAIEMDTSKADWANGTGTIEIRYRVNGVSQKSEVKMENDWLDPKFLEDVRAAMKSVGIEEKQLYIMEDGGQGCILFCRDKDWAAEFAKKTGITLQ